MCLVLVLVWVRVQTSETVRAWVGSDPQENGLRIKTALWAPNWPAPGEAHSCCCCRGTHESKCITLSAKACSSSAPLSTRNSLDTRALLSESICHAKSTASQLSQRATPCRLACAPRRNSTIATLQQLPDGCKKNRQKVSENGTIFWTARRSQKWGRLIEFL